MLRRGLLSDTITSTNGVPKTWRDRQDRRDTHKV